MIDFHSHILPGMDDGSSGVIQSRKMLRQMASQGIDTVVATPHYYRGENTPQEFVRRREAALAQMPSETGVRVVPGAEVSYFPGIGQCADLALLCIAGTKTLLLEMPFRPWDEAVLREVLALSEKGLTVVLAHMERYFFMQSKAVRRRIFESGIYLQINAAGLFLWPLSAIELRLLRRGRVQIIGSDCHGSLFRPPCAGYAYRRLTGKLGEEKAAQLDALAHKLTETI